MELICLVGLLLWLFVAYKWGDWSSFNKYRATIYIMISGDLLCNALTEGNKLWSMESPTFHIRPVILGITVTAIAYACSIIVFLKYYPEGRRLKRFFYILLWVSIYTSHEWIVYKLGVFTYANGWNLGWSIVLNSFAFTFMRLHQQKPNAALIVFIIVTLFFCYKFNIPFFETP